MRKSVLSFLAASCVLAGVMLVLPASAANPPKPAKPAAAKVAGPKEYGGKMPLPVDQRIERQNSPQDKLVVEVTHSAVVGDTHVAYVKVVWGDLDNVIKKDGKQFYSNWDGNLKLASPATGMIDEKIQFDDGGKAATKPTTKPKPEPKAGTGRDKVDINSGATIDWDSGVVGALDGLRIKITSPNAAITGTLKAGKFTILLNITPGTGAINTPPTSSEGFVARPGGSSVLQVK